MQCCRQRLSTAGVAHLLVCLCAALACCMCSRVCMLALAVPTLNSDLPAALLSTPVLPPGMRGMPCRPHGTPQCSARSSTACRS